MVLLTFLLMLFFKFSDCSSTQEGLLKLLYLDPRIQ